MLVYSSYPLWSFIQCRQQWPSVFRKVDGVDDEDYGKSVQSKLLLTLAKSVKFLCSFYLVFYATSKIEGKVTSKNHLLTFKGRKMRAHISTFRNISGFIFQISVQKSRNLSNFYPCTFYNWQIFVNLRNLLL